MICFGFKSFLQKIFSELWVNTFLGTGSGLSKERYELRTASRGGGLSECFKGLISSTQTLDFKKVIKEPRGHIFV